MDGLPASMPVAVASDAALREDPFVQACTRSVEELYRRTRDDPSSNLGEMCRTTLISASKISGVQLADASLARTAKQQEDVHGQEAADRDVDDGAGDDNQDSPTSPLAPDEAAPLGGEGDGVAPVGCLDFAWLSRRHKRQPTLGKSNRARAGRGKRSDGTGLDSAEYQAAPIVDICAVFGSDPVPPGFRKITHSPYGRRADLNAGAYGHYIYLCYRKDMSRQKPPIVSLVVIFPGRKEFLPPTFSVVRRHGEPVDFNAGTSAESVYVCFKRGAGNPITDVQVLFPKRHEALPRGYVLLDRTPFKYEADLNAGSRSTTVYLAYAQWLRSVDDMNALLDTTEGLVPQGHGLCFNSNGSAPPSAAVRASSSLASHSHGHLLDETQSVTSTRALSALWGHADHLSLACSDRSLIPALRRLLLTPLLTALYTAKSDVVTLALEHLLRLASRHLLLPTTRANDEADEALQEVVIESLCYFNSRVQSERFDDIVQYLRSTVPPPLPHRRDLSPSALQQIFTSCVFLCNFEAYRDLHTEVLMARRDSVSAVSSAPEIIRGAPSPSPSQGTFPSTPYTPLETKGTDCAAYASLRFLLQETLRRFEALSGPLLSAHSSLTDTGGSLGPDPTPTNPDEAGTDQLVRGLVHSMVDGAVDHVELAKTTQRALDCIKRSNAYSYESFWKEILSVSEVLADSPVAVNTFLILSAICKLASEQPRLKRSGGMVERDVAGKLIALDLLCFFLRKGGERFVQCKQFGCHIRRVVVSCLLSNVLVGLDNLDILRRVLTAIFTLWKSYRQWLKVELGVLWTEVIFRLLRFRPFKPHLQAQGAVLCELVTWLEVEPNGLVELYLNYDLDRSGLTVCQQMTTLKDLVATMCSLGEDLGAAVASRHEDDPELRALYLRVLQAVALLTRSLMNVSGHANLIPQDAKVRAISLDQQQGGGWEQDVLMPLVRRSWGPEDGVLLEEEGEDEEGHENEMDGSRREEGEGEGKETVPLMDSARPRQVSTVEASPLAVSLHRSLSRSLTGSGRRRIQRKAASGSSQQGGRTQAVGGGMGRATSVRLRKALHEQQNDSLQQGLKLYRAKGLKRAIEFLVANHVMSDTPRDIAAFLRVYRHDLDPISIGEYLGEGGNGSDTAHWNLIRMNYIRASSFHNMALEPALRAFLTRGGFRLPGEGQKADRILQVFGNCYYEDNKSLACCPFQSADAAYMTSYAIIMLQTDLHKANVGRRKRMTKDEFIANTRHIAPELSRDHLSEMYDSILQHPIAELLFLPSSSATTTAARGASGGPNKGGSGGPPAAEDPARQEALTAAANRQEMATALRGADELLCGLSVYPDRFSSVGVTVHLSPDVVKLMFDSVWNALHLLIQSVLEKASQLEPEAVMVVLDILMYAVSASTFLDLCVPAQAFAIQLGKFKSHQEKVAFGPSPWKSMSRDGGAALGEGGGGGEMERWVLEISRAVGDAKWGAIGSVHALISDIKESLQQSRIREELKAVAKRIEPRANLLSDASRRFIREGDLQKKCRSGKTVKYRFFLFSDQLLYGHRKLSGEYKVHAQLLLSVMRLAESPADNRRNTSNSSSSFQILHCAKSFTVTADSAEMRRVWTRDIGEAIKACAGLKETTNQQLSVISRCHAASERVMQLIQNDAPSPFPAPGPSPAAALLPLPPPPITPPFPPPPLASNPPASLELPPTIGVEVRAPCALPMSGLEHVAELDLEDATIDALNAYADLLQTSPCPVDRDTRAALDGLVLQLHEGEWESCDKPPLAVSPEATAAWKANSGQNQTMAMQAFIRQLGTVRRQQGKATK